MLTYTRNMDLGFDAQSAREVLRPNRMSLPDVVDFLRKAGERHVELQPFLYTVSGAYAVLDARKVSEWIEVYSRQKGVTFEVNARQISPFNIAMWIRLEGNASHLLQLTEWLDRLTRAA